ncbi:Na+/H+ antiporter subunit E [Chloroflexota bacterium]
MKKAEDTLTQSRKTRRHHHTRLAYIVVEFIILFGFWLILSGHYQAKYIVMGAVSAGLITLLTNNLIYPSLRFSNVEETRASVIFPHWGHLLTFVPWLLYSIIKANIQVAWLVIHPQLPIEPALLQFKTGLKRYVSQVTLANSITLTPGTVTIDLEEDTYLVHALAPGLAESLLSGEMQNKVAALFREAKEPPVAAKWVQSTEEVEQ